MIKSCVSINVSIFVFFDRLGGDLAVICLNDLALKKLDSLLQEVCIIVGHGNLS